MHRFIAFVSLIGVLMAAAVGLTFGLARHQPLPDYLAALRFTDCPLPCWIGIDPGTTTVEDAYHRMDSAFAGSPVYEKTLVADFLAPAASLVLRDRAEQSTSIVVTVKGNPNHVVTTISFSFSQKINLGERASDMQSPVAQFTSARLNSVLGFPRRMYVPNPLVTFMEYCVLVFGDTQRGAYLYTLDANRDSPVVALDLFSGEVKPDIRSNRIRTWSGFMSTRHYLQLIGRFQ